MQVTSEAAQLDATDMPVQSGAVGVYPMGDADTVATTGATVPTPEPTPAPKPRRERAPEPTVRCYAAVRVAGGYSLHVYDLPVSIAARHTIDTRPEDTLPRVAAYIDRELRREQLLR